MLEEILTFALLLSIATHALLVKKCQVLEASIPLQTEGVHHGLTEVRELLDEALDMMAAIVPAVLPSTNQPMPSESLPNLILNTLLSRMGMADDDASKTQPQEWEILQPNPTPENETEDQPR